MQSSSHSKSMQVFSYGWMALSAQVVYGIVVLYRVVSHSIGSEAILEIVYNFVPSFGLFFDFWLGFNQRDSEWRDSHCIRVFDSILLPKGSDFQ